VSVVPVAPPDEPSSAVQPTTSRLLRALGVAPPVDTPEQASGTNHPAASTPVVPATPVPRPRLRVLRGLKLNVEYPVYEGKNLIGRHDDKPVDIDLIDQEPPDRIWASRQHAVLTFQDGVLTVEDLHSLNGTFVNRHQVFPGQKRKLSANDVLQIGTIQLKVTY
jgi:hypothetical protein